MNPIYDDEPVILHPMFPPDIGNELDISVVGNWRWPSNKDSDGPVLAKLKNSATHWEFCTPLLQEEARWRCQKCRIFSVTTLAFAIRNERPSATPPVMTALPRYLKLLTTSQSSPQMVSASVGSCQSLRSALLFKGATLIPCLGGSVAKRLNARWNSGILSMRKRYCRHILSQNAFTRSISITLFERPDKLF